MEQTRTLKVISEGTVVSEPVFTPAHINLKAEVIPDYCTFEIYKKWDCDEVVSVFIQGKLARHCACLCSVGKTVDVLIDKHGEIQRIVFGPDDWALIYEETRKGIRPVGWGTPGHPGRQLWLALLQKRLYTPYTGGDKYGVATVNKPEGTIL